MLKFYSPFFTPHTYFKCLITLSVLLKYVPEDELVYGK